MASNYADVLEQLNAADLQVTSLDIGRMVRCRVEGDRERRGWYSLHELQLPGGDLVIVGSYGVWRGNDNGAQKIDLKNRDSGLSSEQREALKRRLAEDRRRIESVRRAAAAKAAERAGLAWAKYSETGESDYLASKHVQGFGVRYTSGNSAVVPVIDTTGRIHGLQFLRTPKQAETSKRPAKEYWPSGMVKNGHFHLIGSPQWIVLVAEGYATAATLHMATGYPVAVAFDAGNLRPVAEAMKKRYRDVRVLICADDDALQKCRACKARIVLPEHPSTCPACGKPHGAENAGLAAASTAAMAVNGAWVAPRFEDEPGRRAQFLERGTKLTDYNDLHVEESLHAVRAQIEDRLLEMGWRMGISPRANSTKPGGEGGDNRLRPLQSVNELLGRYALVYAHGGAVFDRSEHMLLSLSDMRDACVRKDIHRAWCESTERDIVRITEVGFDPGGEDPSITCNLWAGWPVEPKAGKCEKLLEMLWHMCSGDRDAERLYTWVLRWLAYPIQHPGAKMKTTIVVHGPQGTGKNLFFETISAIYGKYGDVIDQSAVEDKFNDWASRKLFMIADEVVARTDLYHIKNKLKALITGNRIRINPKNYSAYWEQNHMNLVFLSNETMPVVLEEDDRRHCVIWTPAKREVDFYAAVLAEIESGGAAALHDHLLNLDLGDFHTGSAAPLTEAKSNLIGLGLDSPTRWFYALYDRDIGDVQPRPCRTEDAYRLYKAWCHKTGNRSAPMQKFTDQIERRHNVRLDRKRYWEHAVKKGPHGVMYLFGEGCGQSPDEDEPTWLGKNIAAFANTVNDYLGGSA